MIILRRSPEPDFVDVDDHERQVLIREAEYQQAADAGSRVLRVSGKVPKAVRQIPGLIERTKQA